MIKEIADNVHKIESKTSGKNIVIFGGVHGDELTGILVVEKLLRMFKSGELQLVSGSVTLVLGNEKAIAQDRRCCANSEINLNRCFTEEILTNNSDCYETKRAQLLASILKDNDVLLDIHSTKQPSRAFLACQNSSEHQNIHRWFDVDTIVTDDNFVLSSGEPSTTDEYMNSLGKIGVCFETGYNRDTSVVDAVMDSILAIMRELKMLSGDIGLKTIPKKSENRLVYNMCDKIVLTGKGFKFKDDFGKIDFAPVKKNQTVGWVGEAEYKSPVDGVVLFQTPQQEWQLGRSVGYIAELSRCR